MSLEASQRREAQRRRAERAGEPTTLASAHRPHLYVRTSDDNPFVQDGMRDGEHLRGSMTQRFRQVFAGSATPWLEVRGGRAEQVVRAIRTHRGTHWLAGDQIRVEELGAQPATR